jgi:hypothetical protein
MYVSLIKLGWSSGVKLIFEIKENFEPASQENGYGRRRQRRLNNIVDKERPRSGRHKHEGQGGDGG